MLMQRVKEKTIMRTKTRAGIRIGEMSVARCILMHSHAALSYQVADGMDLGSEVEGNSNRL